MLSASTVILCSWAKGDALVTITVRVFVMVFEYGSVYEKINRYDPGVLKSTDEMSKLGCPSICAPFPSSIETKDINSRVNASGSVFLGVSIELVANTIC